MDLILTTRTVPGGTLFIQHLAKIKFNLNPCWNREAGWPAPKSNKGLGLFAGQPEARVILTPGNIPEVPMGLLGYVPPKEVGQMSAAQSSLSCSGLGLGSKKRDGSCSHMTCLCAALPSSTPKCHLPHGSDPHVSPTPNPHAILI